MSRKQRHAQQRNQQRQTPQGGPQTPQGKAISSQNAFSHGLTAARLVLPWENQQEFDSLLTQLVAEHKPVTATEGILVREMAEQYWRLQRTRNHEYALLLQTPEIVEQAQTNMALHDLWDKQVILAQRYVTRHERAFHKCLATLRTLQKERRAAESEAAGEAQAPVSQQPEFVSQKQDFPKLAAESRPQQAASTLVNPTVHGSASSPAGFATA